MPEEAVVEPKEKKPKVIAPISVAEKSKIEKLITQRRDSILKALGDELNSNPETLEQKLREDRGINFTTDQMESLLNGARGQVKAAVETFLQEEKTKIELAISDIEDSYNEKEKELKEKHRTEWQALQDQRKDAKRKLREDLVTCEKKVAEEHCPELLKKIAELEDQKKRGYEMEESIKADAKMRLTIIRKSRARLESAIRDAANRALETLWTATDVLERIPTIGEAINMVQTNDGIYALFKRLDTGLMLPAPAPEKDATPKTIDVEVSVATPVSDSILSEDSVEEESTFDGHEHQRIYRSNDR
jgi:hypothetical protein